MALFLFEKMKSRQKYKRKMIRVAKIKMLERQFAQSLKDVSEAIVNAFMSMYELGKSFPLLKLPTKNTV